MTICISTIGQSKDFGRNDEVIVFATDHMISLSQIGQFEHTIEKYKKISENKIVMLAGEALLFENIIRDIEKTDTIDKISSKINKNMIKIRDDRIEKTIFEKFKINYEFLKEVLKQPNYNNAINEMLNYIKNFNLKTTIILAGFEKNIAQIIEVSEHNIVNLRDIGFDAIGTGGTQAINTLLFQRHSKENDLKTTIYNVYKAKKNSEVASGVGKETDLFILFKNGETYEMDEKNLKMLEDIYNKEMEFGKQNESLNEIIANIGEKDVR